MNITKEILESEIKDLSQLSKEQLKEYLVNKEKRTLLHDGDVLSEEACYLLFFSGESIPSGVKKVLVRDLSSSAGGVLPPLTAELHCPVCGKLHPALRISKTTIMQQSLSPSMFVDKTYSFNFPFSDICFSRHPEGLLCQECFDKEKDIFEDEARTFLSKPAEEMKKCIAEYQLNSENINSMLNALLYWERVYVNGKWKIISISGRNSRFPYEWEDEEYKQELKAQEILKEQKREQRRKEKEERARQAHDEYVAKLDETGLPNDFLPSAPASEILVIMELLRGFRSYYQTCSVLIPDMFVNESSKKIYSVIKDFFDNGVLQLTNSNQAQFFLIRKLLEERYGYTETLNLLLPFQMSEQCVTSSKTDYDFHVYQIVKKYVEREMYIVSQKVRHAVHDGCTSPFMLLQYVSDKLNLLNEVKEACQELRSEFPEYISSRLLDFGKYKGREVKDIMEKDPSYISWIIENTRFSLTEEEMEYFKIVKNK